VEIRLLIGAFACFVDIELTPVQTVTGMDQSVLPGEGLPK
jgi:hypothetical protein